MAGTFLPKEETTPSDGVVCHREPGYTQSRNDRSTDSFGSIAFYRQLALVHAVRGTSASAEKNLSSSPRAPNGALWLFIFRNDPAECLHQARRIRPTTSPLGSLADRRPGGWRGDKRPLALDFAQPDVPSHRLRFQLARDVISIGSTIYKVWRVKPKAPLGLSGENCFIRSYCHLRELDVQLI